MQIDWKTCFRVSVTILLLVLCIMGLPSIGNFFVGIFSASSPLVIGCVIAYLANILMSVYEGFYFPKTRNKIIAKSRRPVCMLMSFVTLTIVVVLVMGLVIPQLVSCVVLLVEKVPFEIEKAVGTLDKFGFVSEDIITYLNSIDWQSKNSQFIEVITTGVVDVLDIVIVTITSVFNGLVTTLIAVIFSIYLLSGKEKIANQYAKLMKRFVQQNVTERINHIFSTMNTCFRRYIIGQCTEAVILGSLCAVGMWILKLPYAAMIGALIALTALIPVAGAFIGGAIGAFMIFTISPMKAVVFIIFLLVLQQIEGNIIYPRVVGSSIGLPGVWVLAAVTIGGGMLGIIGMLIGVPLAATAYKLLGEAVKES